MKCIVKMYQKDYNGFYYKKKPFFFNVQLLISNDAFHCHLRIDSLQKLSIRSKFIFNLSNDINLWIQHALIIESIKYYEQMN